MPSFEEFPLNFVEMPLGNFYISALNPLPFAKVWKVIIMKSSIVLDLLEGQYHGDRLMLLLLFFSYNHCCFHSVLLMNHFCNSLNDLHSVYLHL